MSCANVIIRVDRCLLSEMPAIRRVSARTVELLSACSWTSVPIKVPAELNISDKLESGQRVYSAKLSFTSVEEFPRERMGYKATAADGKQYLIGTNERPYPVTSMVEPHPDKITDNQLFEVSVNYTSDFPIPYIAG